VIEIGPFQQNNFLREKVKLKSRDPIHIGFMGFKGLYPGVLQNLVWDAKCPSIF
jgi:hypothetical protein